MGGYISKLLYQEEHYKTNEINSSSLILENRDTCTPQPQKKKSIIDPRSATLGITRTPIEVLSTPQKEPSKVISSVPKHLRRKPYLETNFDASPSSMTLEKYLDPRSPSVDIPRTPITVETFNQNDTPKQSVSNRHSKTNLLSEMHQKMFRFDPRSPATDFDRTPILKPKSLEIKKTCSQENLNTSTHKTELQPSRLSYCETLNSSNLLEINVLPDVVTSLDNSQNSTNKTSEKSYFSNSGTASDNSVVTVLTNRNITSLDDSLGSTPLDFPLELQKIEEKMENFEERLMANSDRIIDNVLQLAMVDFEAKGNETENKIKIWRDSLSPEIQEDSEYDSESESESNSEIVSRKQELVIEYDDDDHNVVGTIKKTEFTIRKTSSVERKKNKHSKRELGSRKFLSPIQKSNEIKKLETLNNRTPLRNRANSNSKSQALDLKSPYLRNKVLLSSTKLQENTPPRIKKTALKSKFNKTQWDGDSTVII